ncbi:MAG: MFS transporter [Rhodoferax sp.]|nr:MFS transporter [Rhodoferax sp.]
MNRHRWKVLAIGFAANAAFSAVISGLPATAVLMRRAYGVDTAAVGTAVGAMGLGIALSEVPWGMLTDRLGDRRVLLAGLTLTMGVLGAMAAWLVPGAPHAWTLLVLALGLIGLVGGSINGSSGRAVMAWFDAGERGLAMGIRQTALPAGGVLGALLLPAVVLASGFAAAYAVLALLCGACIAATWAWLHEPPGDCAVTAAAPAAHASLLRDPQTWRMVTGMALLCVPQIAVLAFTAVFLHDVVHMGVAQTTAAVVLYQLASAALRIWSGRWTDRHGNRRGFMRGCSRWCATIFLVMAVLALAAQQAQAAPLLAPVLFLVIVAGGAAGSCWHGVAFTELAVQAGAGSVGTALGLGNTFVFGSYFLTPMLVPLLLAHGGWPLAWLVVAACALASGPLLRPHAGRSALVTSA